MNKWIRESARLVGQLDKAAAEKALIYLNQDREKSAEEMLMDYALAERLFNYVFTRYTAQKDTLSIDEKKLFELSIELARKSLTKEHPLLYIFLKEASIINTELESEVKSLGLNLLH